jgi:hypothetical protein
MEDKPMPKPLLRDEEALYQIRVRGLLDDSWSEWLDGLAIEPGSHGETLLTGYVRDQAALHGLLSKIRDLGLLLVSVKRVGEER